MDYNLHDELLHGLLAVSPTVPLLHKTHHAALQHPCSVAAPVFDEQFELEEESKWGSAAGFLITSCTHGTFNSAGWRKSDTGGDATNIGRG